MRRSDADVVSRRLSDAHACVLIPVWAAWRQHRSPRDNLRTALVATSTCGVEHEVAVCVQGHAADADRRGGRCRACPGGRPAHPRCCGRRHRREHRPRSARGRRGHSRRRLAVLLRGAALADPGAGAAPRTPRDGLASRELDPDTSDLQWLRRRGGGTEDRRGVPGGPWAASEDQGHCPHPVVSRRHTCDARDRRPRSPQGGSSSRARRRAARPGSVPASEPGGGCGGLCQRDRRNHRARGARNGGGVACGTDRRVRAAAPSCRLRTTGRRSARSATVTTSCWSPTR